MKLIDTVAVVGCLNPADKMHKRCIHHIDRVLLEKDVFVPVIALVEADLVMKARGYDYTEREASWRALEHKIPVSKIIGNSASSIRAALGLQERGMDYFDSLITSLAIEVKAVVVTTDRVMEGVVETEW